MFLTLIIRLRDGGITALVVIILVILIGWGSAKLLNKDDCYIEEVCEDIIIEQLGLPDGVFDITPSSPEK